MVNDFILELRKIFEEHSDAERARTHSDYLKNKFVAFGIKTPVRREITKPFMSREFLPEKKIAFEIVKQCWAQPERDFHQFGMDFFLKYTKKFDKEDLDFLVYLITTKSWWDTVDMLATKGAGDYFKKFPEESHKMVEQWCAQENMWLRRVAILFQLKYKKDTDLELLTYAIEKNLGSKEFFINKAIGWVLRDYTRTDEDWVIEFVEAHPSLNPLSVREALRLLKD